MSTIANLVVPLLIIYVMYRMVRGHTTSFNSRRARLYSRSLTGGNTLLMLAAVQVAVLAFELSTKLDRIPELQLQLALLIPLGIIAALILLVIAHSAAEAVLGALGIIAAVSTVALDYGIAGVLVVVILSMMTLFVLAIVRGFLRIL